MITKIKNLLMLMVNQHILMQSTSSFTLLASTAFTRCMLWLLVCACEEWYSMQRTIDAFTDFCWFWNCMHGVFVMKCFLILWSCVMSFLMLLLFWRVEVCATISLFPQNADKLYSHLKMSPLAHYTKGKEKRNWNSEW